MPAGVLVLACCQLRRKRATTLMPCNVRDVAAELSTAAVPHNLRCGSLLCAEAWLLQSELLSAAVRHVTGPVPPHCWIRWSAMYRAASAFA